MLKTVNWFKIGYSCCFSLRVNLDFRDFPNPKKRFITSTTGLSRRIAYLDPVDEILYPNVVCRIIKSSAVSTDPSASAGRTNLVAIEKL